MFSGDDYQISAIYGDRENDSRLDATMLNSTARDANDWTTILTNGISGAVSNGINGMVNNAVQSGQLQNVRTARQIGVVSPAANTNLLLILAAVVIIVMVK